MRWKEESLWMPRKIGVARKLNLAHVKFGPSVKQPWLKLHRIDAEKENKILEDNGNKRKKDVFEIHDESNKRVKKTNADHEYFSLNTGDKMPIVQFGTYTMKGKECYDGVVSAMKMGYKGLDTASIYDNESEVKMK